MKYIKYIFESSNYSFKTLFNKIKSDFKEFNFKFDDEDESNEIIIVKFDGEEEFTSDIADKTIEMINFLKENHYEIGNPLNIVVKFKKNSNVYNSGTTVESEDDLLKLIGKKNLISIEIECLFSPSDSINYSNAVSDLRYIQRNINNSKIIGFFYFIDPELEKNKNYYAEELKKISQAYESDLKLLYGKELFIELKCEEVWNEIIEYLIKWKKEIPDLPEINFDNEYENTFNEIKDMNPTWFRYIFENDQIFNEIVLTLFPEKKTLKLLLDYFINKSKEKKIYKTLGNLLKSKLNF